MKFVALAVIAGMLVTWSPRCAAEAACAEIAADARVTVAPGKLTLADLLPANLCTRLRQRAERVNLGVAPRAGSVRVFDGQQIRTMVQELRGGGAAGLTSGEIAAPGMRIPERIEVRQAEAEKSCAEVANYLDVAGPAPGRSGGAPPKLHCAALPHIPEDANLKLTRTNFNSALQRREFALRCARPEDCVPFLVWAEEKAAAPVRMAQGKNSDSTAAGIAAARLVSAGQTATLTWDRAGIRVVLPVTCLDGGAPGEFVRVRFKNAAGTLRAEVLGDGTLRASL
jgi:hypothetical protein